MIGFRDPAVLSAEKAQADHCCGNSEDNSVLSVSSSGDCSPIVLTGVMSRELDVARSVLVLDALAQSFWFLCFIFKQRTLQVINTFLHSTDKKDKSLTH
ncbi:hypothetical protein ACJO1Y_21370 [Vibrio parahaemolyticus]|uniref:hypothetical protein n=2 Tax=Vibrio parahaemolyticus TaxID=670 RepID=UPI0002E5A427|nr:hypothetical protein [Vibrio parahaemolyticus]MBE3902098.1 hypothetical protein [Vibrio parahaemolyticus]MBE4089208.1 hypothetical protein [Vibrio parahaemolyticus]MBE4262883.1 hypothetical protein [Vibrio parahaemolyticus]TOJ64915.1 hypothetical protein CGI34_17910 [Vibrio parahaemolyticus]TON76019.1 hypothetical protein CGH51_07050 [Vibrio parahaemolyticus]